MSGAAPQMAGVCEDLGGGFVHISHGETAVIEGVEFAQSGYRALMSTAAVNARDRAQLSAWAERHVPGSSSRLRGVDQAHGTTVMSAVELRDGSRYEADGVWAASADDIPLAMAADCAPVWLAEPGARVFAVVHAGWRGVAAGIVEASVRALTANGARADRIQAAIGPHLLACCFEVGPEVAAHFEDHTLPASALLVQRTRCDGVALDISAAIIARLREAGVRTIGSAEACTRCRADLLHSYRRNGKGGPLMAALAVMPGEIRA